jgi:hypothetical protein
MIEMNCKLKDWFSWISKMNRNRFFKFDFLSCLADETATKSKMTTLGQRVKKDDEDAQ